MKLEKKITIAANYMIGKNFNQAIADLKTAFGIVPGPLSGDGVVRFENINDKDINSLTIYKMGSNLGRFSFGYND